MGAKEFDKYNKTHTTKPSNYRPISNNNFNTDLKQHIQINISIEDAYYKGKVFF
jgi:hypothetical protein